jgi:glycosyltransferase involved in cell wall biosynthesis
MKLVIVSHVRHYRKSGRLYAYAPYAREIEVWADLFDEIIIAAPLSNAEPLGDCDPIQRTNIQIVPQREVGGENWLAKLKLACCMPIMAWELSRALRQGDAIHVRCPGNLGFLGTMLAPLFSKNLVAKFAGQWNSTPDDSMSVRIQRALLSSRWWNGPVTVYGDWPNLPKHVVPFFSAALTADQINRGALAVRNRTADESRNILFVGRLSKAKNVDVLLKALARLTEESTRFNCTIAGEGPELSCLRDLRDRLGLKDRVEFTGGVSFPRVLELYERSSILVLASQTEGWPKAITEAMAFGLIVVGSNLGLIPQMLADDRGFLVMPGDVAELVSTLRPILAHPERYADVRDNATLWARSYSLDSLRESLRTLLAEYWGMPTLTRSQAAEISPAMYTHD